MNPPDATPSAEPPPPSRGRWLVVGLLGLAILGAGGYFGYRAFKLHRARDLAQSGLAVLDTQSRLNQPDVVASQNAWEDVRAAYALRPQDAKVVLATAQAADIVDPDQAVGFWQDLVELDPQPANWVRYGLAALTVDQAERAREALQKAGTPSERDWRYWELKARLEAHANTWEDAFASATKVLQAAPEGEMAAILPLQVARISPATTDDLAAWQALQEAYTQQRLNARQLQVLGRELKPEDLPAADWLLDALAAQSDQDARLLDVQLRYALGRLTPAQAFARAKEVVPPESPEQRHALASWLNGRGLSGYSLEVIDAQMALSRRDLLEVYVDALAQQRRWREMVAILEKPEAPVTEVPRYLGLLQGYGALNEERAFNRVRERLLLAAGRDPVALRQIADRTARLGLLPVTISALNRLTEQPARAEWAYLQLYSVYKQQGDLAGIRRALEELRKLKPNDVGATNDWCYFHLLGGGDAQEVIDVIRPVVEANPELLFPRMTYAFALSKAGRGREALALLEAVRGLVEWEQVQSRQQLVLALVLQANGYAAPARQYAALVNPDELIPEERTLLQAINR
ncbi:MAG: hypothetical protein Q7P63_05595 [Verrucomicrobiota bacterium JB022]|nr:hypothetical protein [Verrucomicrobiota bacterium JB022]